MANFWDTLTSVGQTTIEKISAPITTNLGRSFQNIVNGASLKVAAVTDKIVKSTDPIKNANSPAIPPTTGSSIPAPTFAVAGVNISIILAAALVVAVVYFLSKRST